MSRWLALVLCLMLLGAGTGCYYTVTNPDGTTERISREQYLQLKNEKRTASHLGVPNMFE
jgi:hypothetical protein